MIAAVIHDTKMGPGRPRKDGAPTASKITLSKCDKCDASFRAGIMLQRHILKCNPESKMVHVCPTCNDRFLTWNELIYHSLQHWSIGGLCPLSAEKNCTATFTRRAKILAHLFNKHKLEVVEDQTYNVSLKKKPTNLKNPRTCMYCGKVFGKQSQLKRHVLIHTGEKPFKCNYCGVLFNQKSSLTLHTLIHTKTRVYKCSLCPASFIQKGNLNTHLKLVHPTKPCISRHRCPHCSCSFREGRSLNSHNMKYHQNLTDFEIMKNTIDDVTKNLAFLNSQKFDNSDILQKALFCSGVSRDTINRDEHNQVENTKDGLYTQPDLTFNTLSTKKVYQCDQCPKSFKKNFELTRHIQTHSNVKLFKCDKCDKSFRNATGLNLHQYNKHTIREKNLINIKNKALNQTQQNPPPERNDIEPLENPLDSEEIDIMTLPLDVSLNQSSFSLDNLNITPMNENESQPMTVTPIYNSNNSEITCTLDNAPFQLAINNANYLELDNGLMNIGNFLISNDFSTTIENIAKPLDSQIIQTPNQNVSFEPSSIILNQSQLIDGQYYLNKPITMENEQINNIENQLIDPKINNMEYGIQILDPAMCERKDDSLSEIIQDLPIISLLNTNIDGEPTQLYTLTAKTNLPELNIHNENINVLKSTENDGISFAPENNKTIEIKPVDPQHNKFLELKKWLKEKKRACAYKDPPLSNCCDQCPASFKKPSDLVRHRRVHTGEKPFICEYCNKAFSLKCTLTTHQILHQKPSELLKVPCKVCGKMIRSGSAMNLHMAIHSGVRPFQCEFCSATFRTSGHHLIHLKVHTKESAKKSNKKVLSELIQLCENDWNKTKS